MQLTQTHVRALFHALTPAHSAHFGVEHEYNTLMKLLKNIIPEPDEMQKQIDELRVNINRIPLPKNNATAAEEQQYKEATKKLIAQEKAIIAQNAQNNLKHLEKAMVNVLGDQPFNITEFKHLKSLTEKILDTTFPKLRLPQASDQREELLEALRECLLEFMRDRISKQTKIPAYIPSQGHEQTGARMANPELAPYLDKFYEKSVPRAPLSKPKK